MIPLDLAEGEAEKGWLRARQSQLDG